MKFLSIILLLVCSTIYAEDFAPVLPGCHARPTAHGKIRYYKEGQYIGYAKPNVYGAYDVFVHGQLKYQGRQAAGWITYYNKQSQPIDMGYNRINHRNNTTKRIRNPSLPHERRYDTYNFNGQEGFTPSKKYPTIQAYADKTGNSALQHELWKEGRRQEIKAYNKENMKYNSYWTRIWMKDNER
jgi:hypothetical protein